MQPGPFVPPPPPVVSDREVRPSVWWFVVAGGLALAGIVGAAVLWVTGVTGLSDTIDGFTRVDVPGSGEVTIDEPGGYSIYHEYGDAANGGFPGPVVVHVSDPSGNEVVLRPYSGTVTYDMGGHEGVGIYTFRAERSGTYEVTTDGAPESTIAVGRGIGRRLVRSIVGGFVVGGIGVVAGIVLAAVTGVRRGRSRRLLTAARLGPPGGWGGPPGAPGAWGGPPPGAPGGWGGPPGAPGAWGGPPPGAPGGWGAPPGAGWQQPWPGPPQPGPPPRSV
jgi:hypothetical protein